MEIHKVPINTLTSPDWNPRQITEEELTKLETSLKEFGYIEPIIVNDVNNHIIGGNQRCKALKTLGYEEVDVVYVHIEDLAKEKACNVALNKISGDWDNDKLRVVLEEIELSPIDVSLTGFDDIELTDMEIKEPVNVHEDEYEIPDEDDITVNVKTGDLYQLGNHYLLCGDATKQEDINTLIHDNKIHMILTDPPYGMGLDTDYSAMVSDLKFVKEKNTDISGKKYKQGLVDEFNDKFIENILNLNIKETFLWGADYYTECIPQLTDGSWIVWDKRLTDDADKMFGSTFELCWSKNKHKREIARVKWAGIFGTEQEFDHKRHHPTQKPIKLNSWFIEKYSDNNNNVLDLFGGSGSTLIACEQLNRNCYMMELDPYYCQVIINRWETYTGKTATKIN